MPLGFTSDHLETLYEIDIELKKEFEKDYQKATFLTRLFVLVLSMTNQIL